MKRSRLNPKRTTPRRNEGRITHGRIKPKAGAKPTPEEARHIARVRKLPCLVSGKRATVHHVTGYADRPGRFSRSHRLVVPLAGEYHQTVRDPSARNPSSVEGLSHQGFYEKYGIDLLAEAKRLWEESVTAAADAAPRPSPDRPN